MNTYTHVIIDAVTNETQIFEFTDEEITQHKEWVKKQFVDQEKQNAIRQTALAKLGLTADEIAALFG